MFEGLVAVANPGWVWGPVDIAFPDLVVEGGAGLLDPVQTAFDDLNRIERAARQLEAARAEALVTAYTLAVEDAAARFGTTAGGRGGPIARSFLKQTAAELQMTEGAVGHLLDTTIEARETMPRTWSAFTEGRAPWRAID